ncbi:hypothetical protein WMF45_00265 [Sorangium sp. So ce448]
MIELRCPVRSAIHVSERPLARFTVMKHARASWILMGCRASLRSNSSARSTLAARR